MAFSLVAFLDYLEKEKNFSRHTVLAYQNDIRSFFQFNDKNLGGKPDTEISYKDVRAWLGFLSNQNFDHKTINRKISALKSYFKFVIKIGEREDNPMKGHHTLKIAKKAMTPLSLDEMRDLLDHLHFPETYSGVRDKLILDLFYHTGMRRSELIQLKIHDADLGSKTVKVLGKRNKERIIPLTNSICVSIEKYLTLRNTMYTVGHNFLFLTDKGNMLYPQFVYNLVKKHLSQVTAKKQIGPHILRHTFATHLLEGGANLNATKELLGHTSLAATQVYTHTNIAELKKVYQNTHPRKNVKPT